MVRSALALTSIAVLLLVGCTTGGLDPEDSATTDPAADPATEQSGAPAEPIDPTDPACLIGDWLITQSAMQGFYDAVTAEAEGGVEFTIVGDTGLSFTSDSYEYTPSFTLELLLAGVAGQGVTTGSIGGGWTGAAGVITTTLGFNNLSTQVTIAGAAVDASELLGSIIASDPINQAPFDCSDPQAPVLQFEIGGGARTPVSLTPAI